MTSMDATGPSDMWGWAFEIERGISGCLGYTVTSAGRVLSYRCPGGRLAERGEPLTLYRRPYGNRYVVVCLRPEQHQGSKVRCLYVHRLVAEAFLGPCPPGFEARHLDGNTANNNVRNLTWGTRAENVADTDRHGQRVRGSGVRTAKLTEPGIDAIRELRSLGLSCKKIGGILGVSESTVAEVLRGEKWTHVPPVEGGLAPRYSAPTLFDLDGPDESLTN
jgi:hypothetical protein